MSFNGKHISDANICSIGSKDITYIVLHVLCKIGEVKREKSGLIKDWKMKENIPCVFELDIRDDE